ncbi:hypothetical protein ILYODFUR_035445 [Ilyodon furcidens]|uniref:Uncharacterized protein n=1 Tax=Ilyodon furcidens TaxID=33524 RepID=A0ABV0VMF1_9TELE
MSSDACAIITQLLGVNTCPRSNTPITAMYPQQLDYSLLKLLWDTSSHSSRHPSLILSSHPSENSFSTAREFGIKLRLPFNERQFKTRNMLTRKEARLPLTLLDRFGYSLPIRVPVLPDSK